MGVIMHVTFTTVAVDENRGKDFGQDFRTVAEAAAGDFLLDVFADGAFHCAVKCRFQGGEVFVGCQTQQILQFLSALKI